MYSQMKKAVNGLSLPLLLLGLMASCSDGHSSKSNYVFKPAPNKTAAAKIFGKEMSYDELFRPIASEIYEAEKRVHDLKMMKIKQVALAEIIKNDKRSKGMTEEAFLEKYVTNKVKVSKASIEKFIKERQIPAQHLNEQMRERINKYLAVEEKKKATEKWFDSKMAKTPIEVYLKRPLRPVFEVDTKDTVFWGKANAKVTIVEFSDFQCPYCADASKIVAQLKKKYKNKIKIVFKNFPLPFHKQAQLAAEYGLCMAEQKNKLFWKMHDKMFADQKNLSPEGLEKMAKAAGGNMKKLKDCLASDRSKKLIARDKEQGAKLNIRSTPTFFVNGKLVAGARSVDVFTEVIDEELAKK